MDRPRLNWIASFIWGIADDVLRDLYVRGKYRDVILPMTVLRRLDAVLEPTKQAVLEMRASLDRANIVNQDAALRQASGNAFYNTSGFTLRDLRSRASRQQLRIDFEAYLDGFSPNVQEILEAFEFRNQIPRLSKADALGTLIEKFLSPDLNVGPKPMLNADGSVKNPGLDNHAMGTIFEELVRRFNEENNEEAGEHWTPRDAVRLMANLVFLPVADDLESGTYLIYDAACGTGGMLTVAEETLRDLAEERGKEVATHLYGQEISSETYAIAKADLLLKGEGEAADNIVGGPEWSTLSNDAFPSREFDFMLSNPPYGKSWKSDLERMGGKTGMKDPRFVIEHAGDPEYSLITRSSDGQMLFLANLLSKMKHDTPLGSRIAEVHNGSSLFTGDAGQGESNIRRWIIENDWLEAIVALPPNMFYNTGIATYIWVLTNRKPEHRRGQVQLIDATQWFTPLRKNLGNKNCELSDVDIRRITDAFLAFEATEQSKILPNAAFGYHKVAVERPLRLAGGDPGRAYSASEIKKLKETADRSESAPPLIRRIHPLGTEADGLRGLFNASIGDESVVVEYEPDPDLRDTEQVPVLEHGGVDAFLKREVLPYASDAWYVADSVKTGYEISFTRYFYRPQPMRSLDKIRADILALERQTEGLLVKLLEEQERAIILGAVTRGIDPSARSKPSGVPWLGDIPVHWDLVPNRSLMQLKKRPVGAGWETYPLLSLTKQGVILRDMENPEGKFPASFDSYQEVEPGDLVFCLFDIDETPRAVGKSDLHGMITGAYTCFSCDPQWTEWLYHFYLAMDDGKRLKPLYTGLRKVITTQTFLSAKVPLPPVAERDEILTKLRALVGTVDEATSRARREIELLGEYRARLVSDVVTGKLDVWEAAARLPDETREREPLPGTDNLAADDGGAAEDFDPAAEESGV